MKTLTLVAIITAALSAALFAQSLEVQLQRAEQKEVASGNVKAAIDEYKRIASRAGKDRAVAAKALLRMAEAHQKLGDAEANKIYQQIVRDYSDQRDVLATAKARLNAGGSAVASGVVNRQVWGLPAEANFGRVSPDGRYAAYTSKTDLMVRELATGMGHSVAHFASGRPGPTLAWSPDGHRLVFEFFDGSGVEIRSVNVDGTGLHTLLTRPPTWARVLDFFPDGNRVLCSREQNGDSLVFWININDGSTQDLVLRPGPGGSGWPRLSPDGRYVALRNSPGLSLLATDGTGETVISRNAGDLNPAGWSPDGSRLLFVRRQSDRVDLWAAPVANGKPGGPAEMVYRDFGSISAIENHVTKDGSLYYVKSSGGGGEVYTALVDFGAGKMLTEPLPEFGQGSGTALWSPDGKHLAYAPGFSSPPTLLVRSFETGQTRDVKPKLQSIFDIDWSPDGLKFAAWGQDLQGQGGIFSVDLQTGDSKVIVAQPAGTFYDEPRYSPDGRKLYYRRRMRQSPTQVAYALMEQDLFTGQQRVLLDESVRGRDLAGIRPSPDGRYLAYGTVDRAGSKDVFIHIRPVNEDQTREVRIPASEASLCHPMDWIKDSSAVIYHCDAPSGTSNNGSKTWILPMADLKPRQLALGFSEVMLSVHPDGKRIAFSVNRPSRTELHVLENFLPLVK